MSSLSIKKMLPLLFFLNICFSSSVLAASFVVNITADTDDGTCDVANCTLREAILAANNSLNGANPDEITFSINPLLPANDCRTVEGATICRIYVVGLTGHQNTNGELVKGLPIITEAVKIDGAIPENRPDVIGYPNITRPSIEVSGENAPAPSTGIIIASSGSLIQGLILHSYKTTPINEMGGEGINLYLNSENNIIRANYIATDASGRASKHIDHQGVNITNSSHNMVGGENLTDRNVFLDVGFRAVDVATYGLWGTPNATDNIAQNNFVGLGVAGEKVGTPNDCIVVNRLGPPPLPIPLDNVIKENKCIKNADLGINVFVAEGTKIINNEVIDSGSVGILLTVPNVAFNNLKTDIIGNTVTGSRNTLAAVRLGNNIEGLLKDNIIKNNLGTGVLLAGSTEKVAILNNSIVDNAKLGIDIAVSSLPASLGVTPNDPLDSDAGVNHFQNFPVLDGTLSFINPSLVQVYGSLDSEPNAQYLIQAFSSECGKADPSGYGEGQVFIGEHTVQTDNAGHVDFHFPANANAAVGSILTATATNIARNETSEFSPWVNVGTVGNASKLACP